MAIHANLHNDIGNIVVKIHSADTGNSSNPGAEVATLTGSDPDTAGLYTYTCSGTCALAANTTYFVVMSTTDTNGGSNGRYYRWAATLSDAEAGHPSDNGWTIADVGRYKSGSNAWNDMGVSRTGLLHIAADD